MKLEVGKSYVARNGNVVTIEEFDEFEKYPYLGGNGEAYAENGDYCLGAETQLDLIREHNPKPEGPTLTMSLDLSDMRNEMERLNRATKAFLEEYDRD